MVFVLEKRGEEAPRPSRITIVPALSISGGRNGCEVFVFYFYWKKKGGLQRGQNMHEHPLLRLPAFSNEKKASCKGNYTRALVPSKLVLQPTRIGKYTEALFAYNREVLRALAQIRGSAHAAALNAVHAQPLSHTSRTLFCPAQFSPSKKNTYHRVQSIPPLRFCGGPSLPYLPNKHARRASYLHAKTCQETYVQQGKTMHGATVKGIGPVFHASKPSTSK